MSESSSYFAVLLVAVVVAGVATSFYSMKQEQEEAEEMYQAKWVFEATMAHYPVQVGDGGEGKSPPGS